MLLISSLSDSRLMYMLKLMTLPLSHSLPPNFFLRISEKRVFQYSSSSLSFIISLYFIPNYGLQIIYSSFKLKKPTSNPAASTVPTSGNLTRGVRFIPLSARSGAPHALEGLGRTGPPPSLGVMQLSFIKLLQGQLLKQNIDFQSGPCLT